MSYTVRKLLEIAVSQIGYKEKETNSQLDNKTANAGDNNYTKYARDLHAAGYYQASKQGYAWCDMFHDHCHLVAAGMDPVEAQRVTCQTGPYGAGCYWSAQYYKEAGRFYTDNPQPGDQIFFHNYAHTGIVEKVENGIITTIEGNTSNMVARRTYKEGDSCIDGYGRPLYDTEENEEDEDTGTNAGTLFKIAGIDVSKWQGKIDWEKVKADGVKFAMIRLGYGSKDGNSCGTDKYFAQNVANAVKAGVDVGCYFYSYALSVEAARKEAEYVVNVLSKYKGVFTYPVAFDIEDKSQAGLGKAVLTDMVIAFGDTIEKAGYYCSVYCNLNWLKNYLDDSKLARFDHWLAQWADSPTYTGAFGMWQRSSTGKVDGISGNVDLDVAYKDYPSIIRNKKLNGFGSEVQTAPEEKEEPTVAIKKGDVVVIADNAVYYTGEAVPDWVLAKKWIVKENPVGNRAVIDKSTDGKYSICSPIDVKYLIADKPYYPDEGDVVNFTGNKHYTNANATKAKSCKPGKARVTSIHELGESKHPYHVVAVDGGGSNVYGWVDADTITKL